MGPINNFLSSITYDNLEKMLDVAVSTGNSIAQAGCLNAKNMRSFTIGALAVAAISLFATAIAYIADTPPLVIAYGYIAFVSATAACFFAIKFIQQMNELKKMMPGQF